MATYKALRLAPTWTIFIGGVLTAQGKAIPENTLVIGVVVGKTLSGESVLKIDQLYSKTAWFALVGSTPPPVDPPSTGIKTIEATYVFETDGVVTDIYKGTLVRQ
jgi:hypothetical protein